MIENFKLKVFRVVADMLNYPRAAEGGFCRRRDRKEERSGESTMPEYSISS